MKQVDIRSIIIPSRSRSGNYPTGSTVTPGGGGSSTPVDLSPYMKLARWFENFEEKTDENNVPYLYCKKNLLVYGGVTSYSSGGNPVVPPIYAGIPFDNKTIWLNPETQLVEVIGGTGGSGDIDATKLWQLLSAPTSEPINISHLTDALNGYATTEQLNSKWTQDNTKISHWDEAYTKSHEHGNKSVLDGITSAKVSNWDSAYGWGDHNQEGYAHLAYEETFTGLKHFTKGLSVGSNKKKIYESNGVVYIDGDLAVTGGVTAYALGGRSISSIMDGVIADEVTITVKNINGVKKLAVIGGTGGGEADSVEWNNIKNIPTWITDTNPSYTKSESDAKYVTALATSGNNLTYTKNGTTTPITVPYATNAGTLSGKSLHLSGQNPYGKIPFVSGFDGGMEIGKFLDFHTDKNDDRDYAVRLQATNTTGGATVALPSKAGTLALLTDNVASATKLQTSRNIWGKSFDGTANVNGRWELDGNNGGKLSIFDSGTYRSIQSYGGALCINVEGNNVGIGTSTAAYKLTVKGECSVSDKIITNNFFECAKNNGVILSKTGHTNTKLISWVWEGGYGDSVIFEIPGNSTNSRKMRLCSDTGLIITGNLIVEGNILSRGGVTAYAAAGSEEELESYFLTTSLAKQNLNADTLNASNMVYYPSSDMNTWTDTTFTNFPTSKPAGGFMLMVLKEGNYLRQIYSSYNDSHLYQRYQYFSGGKKWSGWLKIANSSDKFDSIDFSTGSTIKAPSGYNFIGFYKGTDVQKIAAGGIYVGASYANTNNVPVGSVYATEFKQTSDIRKKNKLNDIIIPTYRIASAPIFRFSWKDTNRIDVGSSAQYWKDVLPDLVSELEDGTLSMNYSNIAVVCVVSLARQMQTEITKLNKEIVFLKNKIKQIGG